MHIIRSLGSLALLASLTPVATQAQVFLTLSAGNVIGGSPVFSDSNFDVAGIGYAARNIFNQQTGPVVMSPQQGNAWFPYEFSGSGLVNRFVTIDLGASTVLSNIEIFNSNQADRGTLHFSLAGGDSIVSGGLESGHALGSVLATPVTLLPSTVLTYSTANPVAGQSFSISDMNPYRYLQLTLIDGQAHDPVAGLGLAEVRISAVPEPAGYAGVTGAVLLGFMVWRRRAGR